MAIHHYLPQVSLASLVLYYSLLYAYAPRLSHNTPTSNIKLEDFLQEGNPATLADPNWSLIQSQPKSTSVTKIISACVSALNGIMTYDIDISPL